MKLNIFAPLNMKSTLTPFCKVLLLLAPLFYSVLSHAQTGEVRGFVYDKENGEPLIFTPVYLQENMLGKATDINGFYVLSKIKPGRYTLKCFSIGYDTGIAVINIKEGGITNQNLYLKKVTKQLEEVVISGERQKAKTEVKISNITITQKELKQLPTFGGEPDLVQYLQVLPGVVFSGDQGGQLYIRGGSPVQNRIMIDGMMIYNPFHSIGLFSVFDADIIRSAEVFAGGFNAQYGGRIGAVVDINTREGNKKEFSGKLSVNPITSKLLLEGPLAKFSEESGSTSYLVSYKTSYLDQTSKTLYNYSENNGNANGLPFSFNDLYGKLSYVGSGGSKLNVFGFNFNDQVNYPETKFSWNAYGMGTNFFVVPEGSTIINGAVNYSRYEMSQKEGDNNPRESGVSGFTVALNFTNFLGKDDIKYGFEINGFNTDFIYTNQYGREMKQDESTTELCGFVKYKKTFGKLIIEPGFRVQAYASLGNNSYEPRLGAKYNLSDRIRIKGAWGMYSQNLISAVSDQDVVNLFYGFLSGSENIPSRYNGKDITHRMQTATHYIGGLEIDVGQHGEINVEGFYKDFTQLTNVNRDKKYDNTQVNQFRPESERFDFIIETGDAYGMDFRYKYEFKRFYIWAVYSLTYVNRNDGVRSYMPHFDRRHNINIVTTYSFGSKASWSANVRWNYGSGFPFTQTQGFYEQMRFGNGVSTDYVNQNGSLGVFYTDINKGRLPDFHRLDFSLSKKLNFGKRTSLTVIAAATNVYNRANIFYFDRTQYKRVDQLPIIPTVGINLSF
ncbi:MAG: TonB-dependent receptor [Bacteroidota bacterium]